MFRLISLMKKKQIFITRTVNFTRISLYMYILDGVLVYLANKFKEAEWQFAC